MKSFLLSFVCEGEQRIPIAPSFCSRDIVSGGAANRRQFNSVKNLRRGWSFPHFSHDPNWLLFLLLLQSSSAISE